jgi:hypothetical protein
MEILRLHVLKSKSQIEVLADLAAGWNQGEEHWGFYESGLEPYGDQTFRCSARLTAYGRESFGQDAIKSLNYSEKREPWKSP